MRRRAFLRSVGAAAAGMVVGLRAAPGRAAPVLTLAFQAARSRGKPLLVATLLSAEERQAFRLAQDVLQHGGDPELAVRLLLVDFWVSFDAGEIHALTGGRANAEPPSLAMIDGPRPRLVQEAQLDGAHLQAGLERFLRETVPLSAAWLDPRVAAISRRDPGGVKRLRAQIAAGQPLGALARAMPAVAALEAVRREGAERDRLLAELVTPAPAPRRVKPKAHYDSILDCGLGAQLINPLGQRFAGVFTNRRHGRGRNNPST